MVRERKRKLRRRSQKTVKEKKVKERVLHLPHFDQHHFKASAASFDRLSFSSSHLHHYQQQQQQHHHHLHHVIPPRRRRDQSRRGRAANNSRKLRRSCEATGISHQHGSTWLSLTPTIAPGPCSSRQGTKGDQGKTQEKR
jgi:hypothetical protein